MSIFCPYPSTVSRDAGSAPTTVSLLQTRVSVTLTLLNLPSEDCNFQGSAIALKSANQANAVVIANNNMEGQSLAGIVVGNSIGGMIIE